MTTKIEWTEATWNPIIGCSIVSPGCTHCYAMKDAWRKEANPKLPAYSGLATRGPNGDKPPHWTGKVAWNSDSAIMAPLTRKKPTMYFVNSMGDLFHEDVPDEWIDRVFAIMALCPQHTFQVLTKRADRMRDYLSGARFKEGHATERIGYAAMMLLDEATGGDETKSPPWPYDHRIVASLLHGPTPDLPTVMFPRGEIWPLPNVWLGVSAERQKEADERIPHLLNTPSAIRFVSAEPLLGPISFEGAWYGESALDPECWGDCGWCSNGKPPLHNCRHGLQSDADFNKGRSGLDWVIVGGESGKGARPMHPDWAHSIRDQCAAADVPFFFKQWGDWRGGYLSESRHTVAFGGPSHVHLGHPSEWEGDETYYLWPSGSIEALSMRVGKTAAGRLLDGQAHEAMPKARAT